ncbi:hypothetical protein TWF481_005250 [Arthrobotrys musiformis]|uniref:RING-type domain-containing protein n=1 Tax=Arthrobotrys musiformis TaxID=47236 RepID=A0AAV9WD48_9PEZI
MAKSIASNRIQVSITSHTNSLLVVLSHIYFWSYFFIWLLPPFENRIQILIGFEKSCPDASKHFLTLPKYTTDLFSRNGQPHTLSLTPKEDSRAFVRKAYQRYLHRKSSEIYRQKKSFSIDDQGLLQRGSEWRTFKQRGASSIYTTLQNCTLKNLETSASVILIWQLCRDFGPFNFPWTASEIDCSAWRHAVDYSFFGSDRNWNPISFRKPMESLNVRQIRNRIAFLGESIGWHPDFYEEIKDSEVIVAFREETEATCFFCCDRKQMWQMCILHCEHTSCIDCVKRNYRMCIEDTSLLPPKCCKKYPLVYASVAAERTNEIHKLARWIATGRVPSPIGRCYACEKDIWPGAELGDVGLCVFCNERTCLRCNVKWHGFSKVECQIGQLNGLIAMVMDNQWSQCYHCGLVVERREGCAHIKCRCGAEFCYHCGGKWPECPCRTTGKKLKLNIMRDQGAREGGEEYSKGLSAQHHSMAVANEQRYMEVADVLRLLKVLKTYQEGVVREIGNLRRRLRVLNDSEEDIIEYGSLSAV